MEEGIAIKGARVYDPERGIDGEKEDIYVKDGRIVEDLRSGKEIKAKGMVAMPAGIEMHSHYAGGKVNKARMMRPEDSLGYEFFQEGLRSGSGNSIPTCALTGYLYSSMGYTLAVEPAVPALKARHTHEDFNDTPMIDKAGLLLMGNNHQAIKYISEKDRESLKAWVSYMLSATKCYGVKAVNPGGVFSWGWRKEVSSLDDEVPVYGVSPREIIRELSNACEKLRLPHPLHLHTNNLGSPGNYETTIDSMSLGDMHITHLQFASYAGEAWKDFCSGAEEVAKEINKRENVTADMGQVVFGETTTMTGDSPFEYHLAEISKTKWSAADVENECGGGIAPYNYRKNLGVNAVQWAIGLELALLIKDPWRIYLTTDHPNAAPFKYYPRIIAWLMDKEQRDKTLRECSRWASERTGLESIERELSLYEIAAMTRAGPAKRLGFKASLDVGEEANISLYRLDPEKDRGEKIEQAFSKTAYTIKEGMIVAVDGKVTQEAPGRTYHVKTEAEKDINEDLKERFRYYTVQLENYAVQEEYLPRAVEVVT